MILGGSIKLSKIFDHNFDSQTDRLYQPLRTAIEYVPVPIHPHPNPQPSQPLPHSKSSRINITRSEQNLIKQSVLIPINQKLVQTNNPEKRMRARSRSYRTLSVEQKIGSPIGDSMFRSTLAQAGKTTEIVYDYDRSNERAVNRQNNCYYSAFTASTLPRTRSVTYIGPVAEHSLNGEQRVDSRLANVERKVSNNFSPAIPASRVVGNKSNDLAGEYYQNCSKYAFRNDHKVRSKRQILGSKGRVGEQAGSGSMKRQNVLEGEYKYNLFNLLDKPVNTECSSGLCNKNEIISPKIKKRW